LGFRKVPACDELRKLAVGAAGQANQPAACSGISSGGNSGMLRSSF
jgi:hypothetical protein